MTLIERLTAGDMLVLGGAIGTELEARGAPQVPEGLWAECSIINPELVRAVHEDYIRVRTDIITANTYSTGTHVLRKMGNGQDVEHFSYWANISNPFVLQRW